jgi:hypothetical protein
MATNEPLMTNFGSALKRALEDWPGGRQTDLAQKTGLTDAELSRAINAGKRISKEALGAICRAMPQARAELVSAYIVDDLPDDLAGQIEIRLAGRRLQHAKDELDRAVAAIRAMAPEQRAKATAVVTGMIGLLK